MSIFAQHKIKFGFTWAKKYEALPCQTKNKPHKPVLENRVGACQQQVYFEGAAGSHVCVSLPCRWYTDPVSGCSGGRCYLNCGRQESAERSGAAEWSPHCLSCAPAAHSTMLETKLLRTKWILPTKPKPTEVKNSTFLQLAPTNFSPSPSGPLEYSAFATMSLSSYSTINLRDSGRPPICCWST